MRYVVVITMLACAASLEAQVDSLACRIPLTGFDGLAIGHVVLGESTPTDVQRVLDRAGGLGPKRNSQVAFTIGASRLEPAELYTPPATMHQLYFERGVLVLVVEGSPRGLPPTRPGFMERFPAATETKREPGWYEMQVQRTACVWLVAVFRAADDTLDSVGHAWVCEGRPAQDLPPHAPVH